ncbi:Multifunctional conjugation protein TraI [Caulifigura coniformis]|uniref:Multifunctional conjugation protein TraI n=1 Tax=Caulifigura coniformis TaxID=2527983 RepID=A0A517SCL9_9PLAN|nr:MobF family relaxase [Caulifigura coniformis]QDT53877.1 Multifunctional conjugation protein TraI [Caulifigura coniformis]
MLRITEASHSSQAKSYFTAKSADYYIDGQEQELAGKWRGKGAQLLGLSGTVDEKDWHALCDNINPETGKTLTARQKKERRVGYDFTFSVPKSVSLVYGLTGDERLLDAFRDSVRETMDEIESEVAARVRKGGRDEDRTTGNAVWGEYVHLTSRPVDGVPDPQLHAHCFVMNATFDAEEKRWKAIQVGDLKADAPYFEARFQARMGSKLRELGLATERTKDGWEIEGITGETIRKFSRRTAEIEQKARDKGITDPKAKAELGAKTRNRKAKNMTLDQLREEWTSRLSPEEQDAISRVSISLGGERVREERELAREAVINAADHLFERSSTVDERRLLAEAFKRAGGKASIEAVEDQYRRQGFLFAARDGRTLVSTREILAEEQAMLGFARSGRGMYRPLGSGRYEFRRSWLNEGQKNAVEHVLKSRDRVVLIRGAAGVGKTTMMEEAKEALESNGHRVFAFAPPAKASRGVLREKGFAEADTVAMLLGNEKLQQQLKGQVIWVDEAGLIGTRTMNRIFQLADRLDARLILSGDRRQHGSVERGDALRLLEDEAGLKPASITEIQRQERTDYKQAIRDLSEGNSVAGFRKLDALDWIREIPTQDRYRQLAADYLATVKLGETALVIAPTHVEGARVTSEIRDGLKEAGLLGRDEQTISVLVNANLTEAERRDASNYQPSDVLVYHQNAKGVRKGQQVRVDREHLPADQAARFQVYRQRTLRIAEGELLRVTKNGRTVEGRAINNGDLVRVRAFNGQGDLVTDKGTISREYSHLALGYVHTSVASQGADADRVFVAQSWDSQAASNQRQFYVSASRGKRSAVFYVDNRQEFLAAVRKSDERMSAIELVSGGRGFSPDAIREPQRPRERELELSHG